MLIRDLERTFKKVDVVQSEQFLQACQSSGFTSEQITALQERVGLQNAPNGELPAIIILERLRELSEDVPISLEAKVVEEPGKLEQSPDFMQVYPEDPSNAGSLRRNQSAASLYSITETCVVDMPLITVSPRGYAGTFPFRHLVYYLVDQQRVGGFNGASPPNGDQINTSAATESAASSNSSSPLGVTRRYSDFVILRDYLVNKYPFRLIPKLPAKKLQIFTNEEFLKDRLKSLRRFMAIVSRHPIYRKDALVSSFLYKQSEFNTLISDLQFMSFDLDEILISQIPVASALVEADSLENVMLVARGTHDVQQLLAYCYRLREIFESLIQCQVNESTILKSLSSVVSGNQELAICFCTQCATCVNQSESDRELSLSLNSLVNGLEETVVLENESILEKLQLLMDLFEGLGELIVRSREYKFPHYDELSAEIANCRQQLSRLPAESQESHAAQNRLEALQAEIERHQTFGKFIQYCLLSEIRWTHLHKEVLNTLVRELMRFVALKNRQWVDRFVTGE